MRRTAAPVVSGVYVIGYGSNVYVGEAHDVFARSTYELAERLDLPRGIAVELPGAPKKVRTREEARVAALFTSRGFTVVSWWSQKWSESRAQMFQRRPDVLAALSARTIARNQAPATAATRAKRRAAQIGKKLSPDTCAKLSALRSREWALGGRRRTLFLRQGGTKVSPETRAKLSAASYGRVASPATRMKMSASATARWERWRQQQQEQRRAA